MIWVLATLAAAALVVIAAFGRLIEVTYVRLSRARAAGLDEASVTQIAEDREVVLGPAALLRVACQATLVGGVAWIAVGRLPAAGVVLALAVAAVVLAVLTETLPRAWAIADNDRMARVLAPAAGCCAESAR